MENQIRYWAVMLRAGSKMGVKVWQWPEFKAFAKSCGPLVESLKPFIDGVVAEARRVYGDV